MYGGYPRFPAMLNQPFDDALVACNQLYNLPARFFHLNADATEITDILGDYYENEVAHFFKLYDTILHFDDDVMHCTMVDLIDETGDGPECRTDIAPIISSSSECSVPVTISPSLPTRMAPETSSRSVSRCNIVSKWGSFTGGASFSSFSP